MFDENASNHLAFGSAYAFNLQGGTEMSEEELAAAGLNRSQTHVDFMVGSDKMNIDGIKEDGTIVPVLEMAIGHKFKSKPLFYGLLLYFNKRLLSLDTFLIQSDTWRHLLGCFLPDLTQFTSPPLS